MSPKVSVVTTIYNGEKYLEKCVNSILNQTFADFEFIIVDDGSTDKTLKKLLEINSPRIKIIQQPNQGQAKALISGIKQARGDLIARLDVDDYSLHDRLKRQVEFMDLNPKVVLCGSRFEELYNKNLLPQRVQFAKTDLEIKRIISHFNPFAHSATMFRRDAYLKVGGYDKSFSIGMDYHLWIRLMEVGEVHNLDEVLTIVRVHDESISMKNSRLKTLEGIKIRYHAYSKFGGNELLTGFFFLKSLISLLLPSWLKNFFLLKLNSIGRPL